MEPIFGQFIKANTDAIHLAVALLLGEWQMIVRSPLHPWINNPEHYYRSVTGHGVVMAYVLPTLVDMLGLELPAPRNGVPAQPPTASVRSQVEKSSWFAG